MGCVLLLLLRVCKHRIILHIPGLKFQEMFASCRGMFLECWERQEHPFSQLILLVWQEVFQEAAGSPCSPIHVNPGVLGSVGAEADS